MHNPSKATRSAAARSPGEKALQLLPAEPSSSIRSHHGALELSEVERSGDIH
jgi:hypothetical protein